jgi:hypothetical protein
MAPKNESVPVTSTIQSAPTVLIAPSYTDHTTGAVYVHQDLAQIVKPWEAEGHIKPIDETQRFGDVESFADFVKRFAGAEAQAPLLTWNERGLRAILDYHIADDEPGRCAWVAEHPFQRTDQWTAWALLAGGQMVSQRDVVERLEDLADDIVDPQAAELLTLLRSLKGTNNAEGSVEVREDGTSTISYARSSNVSAGAGATVPATIKISIPVFKGHTVMADVLDKDGKPTGVQRPAPVPYGLTVRVRVDSNDGKVSFRLSRPQADQVFEAALADRIATARELLSGYQLLRSTANG